MLRQFWYSFIPLITLLSLGTYIEYKSGNLSPSLLIMISFLLIGYFINSVVKQKLVIYFAMSILILLQHLLLLDDLNVFLLLVILFTLIDSTNRVSIWHFRINLMVSSAIIIFLLYFYIGLQFDWIILLLIISYPLVRLNEFFDTFHQKQETYEKLLSEYRQLKRQAHDAERAARLEERTKIARDIHDSVGHNLTALLMKLQMLKMQDARAEYDELRELASQSLEETRQAVKQLQVEEHEGISSVLQLIRKLESESHISLVLTIKKGVLSAPLSNQQNVALYRVLQESLTNAMRHAHSREVQLDLSLNAVGHLAFTIRNKIFTQKKFEWGFGLTNMKKRIEELNGQLSVYQSEHEFTVTGTMPLEG